MRWLDDARVAEFGDRVVQLECGEDLAVRGHRDVRAAHRRLHQCLVAEVERVVGLLAGNSPAGTDFSCSKDVGFGQDDDALQTVSNDHLICDQRNLVVCRVVGELDDIGQPGGVDVHGPRGDQDRSCGDDGGEPRPSEVIDDLGRTHDEDRSVGRALPLGSGAGIFRPRPGFPHVVADGQDVAIEVRGIGDRCDVFTAMPAGAGNPHHSLTAVDPVHMRRVCPVELSHGGGAVPVAGFGRRETEDREDGLGGEMASSRQLGEFPDLVAAEAGMGLDQSDVEAVDHHLGVARSGAVPDRVEDLHRPVHDRVPLVRAELRGLPVAEFDEFRFPGGEFPCDGEDFVTPVDTHGLDAELTAGQHRLGDHRVLRIVHERPPFEPGDRVPCGTQICVVADQPHAGAAGTRDGLEHEGSARQRVAEGDDLVEAAAQAPRLLGNAMPLQCLSGERLVVGGPDGIDRVRRNVQRVGGDGCRQDGGFQEAHQRGDG